MKSIWEDCMWATLAVVLAAVLVCGCNAPVDGLRWGPSEQQKQQALASRDIALIMATNGVPPDSEAAKMAARAASSGAGYAGWPASPLDVSPLFPADVRNAWQRNNEQKAALALKEKMSRELNLIAANELARLSKASSQPVTGRTPSETTMMLRLKFDQMKNQARSIVDTMTVAARVVQQIEVPDDIQRTAKEQKELDELVARNKELEAQANADAVERPTYLEASQIAREQLAIGNEEAHSWVSQVLDMGKGWGLPTGALAGLLGAGGVGAGALHVRKKRRTAAQKKADDEKNSSNALLKEALGHLANSTPVTKTPETPAAQTQTETK